MEKIKALHNAIARLNSLTGPDGAVVQAKRRAEAHIIQGNRIKISVETPNWDTATEQTVALVNAMRDEVKIRCAREAEEIRQQTLTDLSAEIENLRLAIPGMIGAAMIEAGAYRRKIEEARSPC